MTIKLKKKENTYAQVHGVMLRDKKLSLRSKGLGAVLEGYSNNFQLSIKSIEINSTDGIKSIRKSIKELEDGYYLFRFQTRDKNGRFVTYWAFDSQKLDDTYLISITSKLGKIKFITINNLLLPDALSGYAVTDTPLAVYRPTVCRESTTYNNTKYKNTKYKNNLSSNNNSFTTLRTFKKFVLENFEGLEFVLESDNPCQYKIDTKLKINNGFLKNMWSDKDLSPDNAIQIWQYLFVKQYIVLGEDYEL